MKTIGFRAGAHNIFSDTPILGAVGRTKKQVYYSCALHGTADNIDFLHCPCQKVLYRKPHYNHQALLWVKTLVHWYSKSFIGLQIEVNQCSTPQKI